jgi:hypothetical protein
VTTNTSGRSVDCCAPISISFPGQDLPKAEERYLWAMLPARFAIPEFDRFDDSTIARKIDGACLATGRDTIADDEFFMRAVMEMNDDALEEDFSTLDAQLDGAEAAIVFADMDAVVILATVNVGFAKIIPALRPRAGGGQCKREQKSNRRQSDSFEHISSAFIP